MKVLAADGLGFSVPVDSISKIIDHFKKNGYDLRFVVTVFFFSRNCCIYNLVLTIHDCSI